MTLTTLTRLALLIAGAALSVVTLRAATNTQVHPLNGGDNARVQLVVLADHYTAAQKNEFDLDVDNFFKYGVLVDDYYQQQAGNMRIVTNFEGTAAGQASRFDFEIGTGEGNCLVKAGPDTLAKIMDAAGPILATHYLVIGNYPYAFGCTTGKWSYVAVDAVGTDVLPHEFGHIIGKLFDEWGRPGSGRHPGLISELFNCASTPPPDPHWHTGFSGYQDDPGCDLYENGVIHPYAMCRMGASHHTGFCDVCKSIMDDSFDPKGPKGGPQNPQNTSPNAPPANPPTPSASHAPAVPPGLRIVRAAFVQPPGKIADPPANLPRPVLRVLVNFDPDNPKASTVKTKTFATGVYLPEYRRTGQYLFEVRDKTGTREVGVISDQMFKARGHRGGMLHGTNPSRATQLILDVPNEDAKTIIDTTRQLSLVIYRIPNSVKAPIINMSRFAELRNTFTQVALLPLQ